MVIRSGTWPFKIRLFARSALVVGGSKTFTFPEHETVISDHWINDGHVHQGLHFDVRLAAPDIESAMKASIKVVAPLTDLLAATHAAAIDTPVVLFAFDLEPSNEDRSFGQIIYNLPSAWLRRRPFDRDNFDRVWKVLAMALSDPNSGKPLSRALHHLRKSYQCATLIDEFVELWIGLEALNGPLQRKYNLPTTEDQPCRSCANPVRRPVSSGIKYSVINLCAKSQEAWKQIRDIRINLIHGYGELPSADAGLDEIIGVLQQALPKAIFNIMNTEALEPDFNLGIQEPDAILITAVWKGLSPSTILTMSEIPHFELVAVESIVPAKEGPVLEEPTFSQVILRKTNPQLETSNETANLWNGREFDTTPESPARRSTTFGVQVLRDTATPRT